MELEAVRTLALALPETTEAPHHDRSSFRVATKIFTTVAPDEASINVFVDEDEIHAAVAESDACSVLHWGAKVQGVTVVLAAAPPALVGELLVEAWRRRAPKRLLAAYDQDHPPVDAG